MRRLIGLRFQEEGEVEMGGEVYYSRTTCDMHRLYMHVDPHACHFTRLYTEFE
jgi:hypothetical protein